MTLAPGEQFCAGGGGDGGAAMVSLPCRCPPYPPAAAVARESRPGWTRNFRDDDETNDPTLPISLLPLRSVGSLTKSKSPAVKGN